MIQMTIISSILATLLFSAAALKSMGDADLMLARTRTQVSQPQRPVVKTDSALPYQVSENDIGKTLVIEAP